MKTEIKLPLPPIEPCAICREPLDVTKDCVMRIRIQHPANPVMVAAMHLGCADKPVRR